MSIGRSITSINGGWLSIWFYRTSIQKRISSILLSIEKLFLAAPERGGFGSGTEGLAYAQEFTLGNKNKGTGMFSVTKTDKMAIIPIENIERGLHLIPKYGSVVGETSKKIQQIQEESWDPQTRKVRKQSDVNALECYDEFYLNS